MTDRVVRFPHVFVRVADGAPLYTIIDRAVTALQKAAVDSRELKLFRECVGHPRGGGYALTIDEIRNWVETD